MACTQNIVTYTTQYPAQIDTSPILLHHTTTWHVTSSCTVAHHISSQHKLYSSFTLALCDNMGFVSLIYSGWELSTSHPASFCASPIFHFVLWVLQCPLYDFNSYEAPPLCSKLHVLSCRTSLMWQVFTVPKWQNCHLPQSSDKGKHVV